MFKKINESFKEKINRPLLISTFIIFILILIWVVFFKGIGVYSRPQYVSKCIKYMVKMNICDRFIYQFDVFNRESYLFIRDLLRNFLIFVPFGIYLPLISKNKGVFINGIKVALITLTIETIQLVSGIGCFELLDLVNNFIGYLLGFAIYKLFIAKFKAYTINIICLVILIVAFPFMIYDYVMFFINLDVFSPCVSLENYHNLFNFSNTIINNINYGMILIK